MTFGLIKSTDEGHFPTPIRTADVTRERARDYIRATSFIMSPNSVADPGGGPEARPPQPQS